MHDRLRAFQSTLGGFDLFTGYLRRDLMGLKFLQTGHHNLRQMASLVAIGDLYGFIQFAFTQRPGYCWSELARLRARLTVSHSPVNHDAYRIGRHQEQTDHDAPGQCPHL